MPPIAIHFSMFTGASYSLGHILVFMFLSAPIASSFWMQSAAPWFGLHALSVSLGFSPFTRLSQQSLQALLISSSICIRRFFFPSARKIICTPHCLLSLLGLEQICPCFLVYYQIYHLLYLQIKLCFSVGFFACVSIYVIWPLACLYEKKSLLFLLDWFLPLGSFHFLHWLVVLSLLGFHALFPTQLTLFEPLSSILPCNV